jgi:hypothetical protein
MHVSQFPPVCLIKPQTIQNFINVGEGVDGHYEADQQTQTNFCCSSLVRHMYVYRLIN